MKPSLRELEKRLREEPDNLGLRVTLAGSLLEAGRHAEAVDLYRSVAIAYRDQGRTQQAIAVCKSILEFAPDDAVSRALYDSLGTPAPAAAPAPPSVAAPVLPKTPPPPPGAASKPRNRPSTPMDETPLPKALPHHVADPTTGTIKKLSDLDLDTLDRGGASQSRAGSDDSTLPGASATDLEMPVMTRDPVVREPATERIELAYPVETDTEEETSPHGIEALPAPPEVPTSTATPSPHKAAMASAFFAPIPAERRAAILSKFIRRTFTAGTTIMSAGESMHPLVLALSGQLEVRGAAPGKAPIVLRVVVPGEYVGERSLLARVPSTIDLVATTDVEVMLLLPRDFYEIAAAFPALWSQLKDTAARRTREYDDKLSAS